MIERERHGTYIRSVLSDVCSQCNAGHGGMFSWSFSESCLRCPVKTAMLLTRCITCKYHSRLKAPPMCETTCNYCEDGSNYERAD